MDFLQSNYAPVKTTFRSFSDTFYDILPSATELNFAVGYITSDSLIELQKLIEYNNIQKMNLTIGMHYLDKFTKTEYDTAMGLNEYLTRTGKGEVRLVTPFRYHGKLYSYSTKNGPFAGIIGSNNLSSITGGMSRIYESAVLIDDIQMASDMYRFIQQLNSTASSNISELDIHQFRSFNGLLEDLDNVSSVDASTLADVRNHLTDIYFDIPIKGYEASPQSNLNVFFGKGRESKNGLVKPRHWYEVELIVPKNITSRAYYPQSQTPGAVFDVITDDGWQFKCKVSGDYSKNFRSEGDLKILGKWLKGRLENAGVLSVGQPVTQNTLSKYGRNTFTLRKTKIDNLWYLDFGV